MYKSENERNTVTGIRTRILRVLAITRCRLPTTNNQLDVFLT